MPKYMLDLFFSQPDFKKHLTLRSLFLSMSISYVLLVIGHYTGCAYFRDTKLMGIIP